MKKLFILVAGSMLALASQAQVQKGAKLIKVGLGSISYNNSKSSTSYSNTPTIYESKGNSFSISVNPAVSWFLADNLAVGGSVSLGIYHSKSNSSNSSSTTTSESSYNSPSIYMGPTVRYYFGNSEKGRPFAEVAGSFGMYFGNSKSSSSSGNSSETITKPKGDWDAGIYGGYEVFLNSNIGLYGSIGVSYGKDKSDYEYTPDPGTGYTYTSNYRSVYVPVSFGLLIHLVPKEK